MFDKPKWKIPPKRIPSNDCIVKVDGQSYEIHKGEWVEVIQVDSMRQYIAMMDITKLAANNTDSHSISGLCEEVSQRVVDWNWTGLDGKKLPKPYKSASVIEKLLSEEVVWLVNAIQGETPSLRKNALAPSTEKS